MKQSELLEEAVERKATLQNEINELEVRIAEEESRVPPAAPAGPLLRRKKMRRMRRWKMKLLILGWCWCLRVTFQEEGDQVSVSETSLSKIDGVSKHSTLSSQDLLKLSEQCSALTKDRDSDLGLDEPALPATEEDDAQGTQLVIFLDAKAQ